MKAEEKPKYVEQSRKLLESIDIDKFVENPNDLTLLSKINRLIAIFTNFSYNDGQELKRLLSVFQKWARASSHKGTTKNRAVDMVQFIGQKIEEMDIYVIDPPIKTTQDRIIKNLKNEKLWARSSLQGKDLHLLIGEREGGQGEHVHLISDSDTGEIRVDSDDKSPSSLLERVVVITTKSGATIGVSQQGIKTTMEFIENNNINADNEIPILYATGIRHSGGPAGHIEYITLKNIGKEIALDIHWGIRAFGYEWRPQEEPFELEPNNEKEVIFPVSEEVVFKEATSELNIIMEYKDGKGKGFFTRREIIQEKVPTGAFYILKASTFHPPSVLIDDGLRLVREPYHNGDRIEAVFQINTKTGIQKVTIGISRSLLAVLGFEKDNQIKQAILELAHRKIRKMVKENSLIDHLFTTYELPTNNPGGFEAYIQLRNSVT